MEEDNQTAFSVRELYQKVFHIHPADSKRRDVGSSSESFPRNIEQVQELKCLSINVDITTLNEEERRSVDI